MLSAFVSSALWQVLQSDVWNIRGALTDDAAFELGAQRMEHGLFHWYTRQTAATPQDTCA